MAAELLDVTTLEELLQGRAQAPATLEPSSTIAGALGRLAELNVSSMPVLTSSKVDQPACLPPACLI